MQLAARACLGSSRDLTAGSGPDPRHRPRSWRRQGRVDAQAWNLKIQIPPSMIKVGRSVVPDAEDWVSVIVTSEFPSRTSGQVGKLVEGGTPSKSLSPESSAR